MAYQRPPASPERLAYIKAWQRDNPEKRRASVKKYYKAHYIKHPRKRVPLEVKKAKQKMRAAQWYQENRPKADARAAEWARANRAKRRLAVLKSRLKQLGITIFQYQQMIEKQASCCALCFKKISGQEIHLDHCHSTGRVRGLLCRSCNWALAYFENGMLDNAWLLRAEAYVRPMLRMVL